MEHDFRVNPFYDSVVRDRVCPWYIQQGIHRDTR